MKTFSRVSPLRAVDKVFAGYLLFETGLILLFACRREPSWPAYALLHAAMIAAILIVARAAARRPSRILVLLHDFYPVLYVPLVFRQMRALVPAVNPRFFDDLLLSWDKALFGGYAGGFLDFLAAPAVTEILRACWLSYFILPFLTALPLYRRENRGAFHETVLVLVVGWLVSYLGYYAVPALGPGYFPDKIPVPANVAAGGVTRSIAEGLFLLEGRMPDIFPSGHVIIAILALRQAARHRLRGWPLLVPLVAGLIAGTVYLRYHYGVDVIAGAAVALVIAAVVPGRFTCREGPSSSASVPAGGS